MAYVGSPVGQPGLSTLADSLGVEDPRLDHMLSIGPARFATVAR